MLIAKCIGAGALVGLIASFTTPAAWAHQHLAPESQPEQAPMSRDELLAGFGWDVNAAEIRAEKVAEGLHVLFGLGGNIAVSMGGRRRAHRGRPAAGAGWENQSRYR